MERKSTARPRFARAELAACPLALAIVVSGPEGARPSVRPDSNRWEGNGTTAVWMVCQASMS
jgi:hypothetical protein